MKALKTIFSVKNQDKKTREQVSSEKNTYEDQRDKFLASIGSAFDKPELLNGLLKPFAEKDDNKIAKKDGNKKSKFSITDVLEVGWGAAKLVYKNEKGVGSAIGAMPYYIKEGRKIKNGRNADEDKKSFFIKLLEDEKTIEFLKKNKQSIGKVIDTVSPTLVSAAMRNLGGGKLIQELKEVGFDSKYINKNLLPIVTNSLGNVINNPERLITIAQNGVDFAYPQSPKARKEALYNMLDNIDVQAVLADPKLKNLLTKEGATLGKVSSIIIKNNDINLEPYGLTPALVESSTPILFNLIAGSIDTKEQREAFGNIYKTGIKSITGNLTPDDKAIITDNIITIAGNDSFRSALRKEEKNIAKVVKENIKFDGVNDEVVDKTVRVLVNSTPELVGVATTVMFKRDQELKKTLSSFKAITASSNSEMGINSAAVDAKTRKKNITTFTTNVSTILKDENISKFIDQDLGRILTRNQADLKDIAVEFAHNNTTINKQLEKLGIDDELVKKAVDVGIKLSPDLLPFMRELTVQMCNHPADLENIIKNANAIGNAINPIEGATNKLAVKEFIKSITDARNNNLELVRLIDNKLPEMLDKHSKELGGLLNDVLSNTKFGPKLKIDTEQVLKIVSKNIPEIVQIADLYSKGGKKNYARMIKPVATIALKNPRVIKLAINTGINYVKNRNSIVESTKEAVKEEKKEEIIKQTKEIFKGVKQFSTSKPRGYMPPNPNNKNPNNKNNERNPG